MPYCFQFKSRTTGTVETLDTIDRLLCEATGQEYSAMDYSPAYQMVTILAMRIVRFCPDDTINEAGIEQLRKESGGEFTDKEYALLLRFLVTDYEYTAWYQSH